MPIGGIAIPVGPTDLELHAVVASLDGARIIRYKKVGPRSAAADLGRDVADQLLREGAAQIIEQARRAESRIPNPEPRQLT